MYVYWHLQIATSLLNCYTWHNEHLVVFLFIESLAYFVLICYDIMCLWVRDFGKVDLSI